jgi:hypothetical protein
VVRHAGSASFPHANPRQRRKLVAITAVLHLVQPIARLWGRIGYGLTPWRRQVGRAVALPHAREIKIWDENWQSAEHRLKAIETRIRSEKIPVRRGGGFDNWDLEIRGGFFASMRMRLGVEDYPGGKQFLRFRAWPTFCLPSVALALLPAGLALLAMRQSPGLAAALSIIGGLLLLRTLGDCAAAAACLLAILRRYEKSIQPRPVDELQKSATPPLRPHKRDHVQPAKVDDQESVDEESMVVGGEPS